MVGINTILITQQMTLIVRVVVKDGGKTVKKTNLIETNLYCLLLLVLIEQMMTGLQKKIILYILDLLISQLRLIFLLQNNIVCLLNIFQDVLIDILVKKIDLF